MSRILVMHRNGILGFCPVKLFGHNGFSRILAESWRDSDPESRNTQNPGRIPDPGLCLKV
jgi:hypothetical protein